DEPLLGKEAEPLVQRLTSGARSGGEIALGEPGGARWAVRVRLSEPQDRSGQPPRHIEKRSVLHQQRVAAKASTEHSHQTDGDLGPLTQKRKECVALQQEERGGFNRYSVRRAGFTIEQRKLAENLARSEQIEDDLASFN